jgi:hypothetical protein
LEPLVAREPVQPPVAVQAVALVDDHVNDEVAPLFTVLGFAEILTAGAALVTVTVADCVALLPTESAGVVWLDPDASQAASADNAAHTSAQRNMCDAWQARHAWE